jgi:hypothetical protein
VCGRELQKNHENKMRHGRAVTRAQIGGLHCLACRLLGHRDVQVGAQPARRKTCAVAAAVTVQSVPIINGLQRQCSRQGSLESLLMRCQLAAVCRAQGCSLTQTRKHIGSVPAARGADPVESLAAARGRGPKCTNVVNHLHFALICTTSQSNETPSVLMKFLCVPGCTTGNQFIRVHTQKNQTVYLNTRKAIEKQLSEPFQFISCILCTLVSVL